MKDRIDKNDLKGLNAVRNFIAPDYDSVDDEILEIVLRVHIPKLKEQLLNLWKAKTKNYLIE